MGELELAQGLEQVLELELVQGLELELEQVLVQVLELVLELVLLLLFCQNILLLPATVLRLSRFYLNCVCLYCI